MFTMRFDMRAHPQGPPLQELYAAALDMAEWAESRGCVGVQVSEHHASPDGYLPAPSSWHRASRRARRPCRSRLQP